MNGKVGNSITPTASPKTLSMSAKELHDRWLEQKPEGASHPKADCPFCSEVEEPTGGTGVSMSDKTYTEEDLAAAIAAATAPLTAKVAELEAKDIAAETESKIAEAMAPVKVELAEAQSALDVATAKADAAEKDLADLKAFLESEVAEAEKAAEVEKRKEARIEEIKANATYKDEFIAARADRWAAMEDDEFAALIDDLKAAGAKGAPADDELPGDTKLTASGENASRDQGASALGSILDVRRAGIDPRRI